MTPTQQTIHVLRVSKLFHEIVEHRPAFTRITRDLLGVIDILVLDPRIGTLGLQVTTMPNRTARKNKIKASKKAALWLECGNQIELWCWRKLRSGWKVNIDRAFLKSYDNPAIGFLEETPNRQYYVLYGFEKL